MRQKMLLMAFSLLASGCGIQRPDTDICIVNAPNKVRKCYNMRKDYTNEGKIKADAKPFYKPANTVDDLNKVLTVDNDHNGIENLKIYINELRQACK